MNFSTLEWCEGPRAPVPLEDMQTAVVQGTCYFMGGYSGGENIDLGGIHSMSLPALIGYFTSEDPRTKRTFKRTKYLDCHLLVLALLGLVGLCLH